MKILFVCTGNTCRSCMAEAIFNHLNDNKDVSVSSAGITVIEGSKVSHNAAAVIKSKLGIDLMGKKAVQVNKDMIMDADIILTMTNHIKGVALSYFPEIKEKVFTLDEYLGVEGRIIDPFGKDMSVYKETYDQLYELIQALINKLKKDRGI